MTLADMCADLERRIADAERIGALAPVGAVLRAVLADLRAVDNVSQAEPADRLLKVDEAAALLGVQPRWLYDRARTLPFARRLGERTLRFSEAGMRRWLERHPPR